MPRRPQADVNGLGRLLSAIGDVKPLSDDEKHRAALNTAAWCLTHTPEPVNATRHLLQMMGIIE